MQCIPCSMVKCIPIKCSGFHAAWWNEVYSIQCEVMEHYCRQWILCSMIECSGFHEAWLNAVDFMQHGPNHPDWIQCIPWSVNECEDSMHCGAMNADCMQWSPCSEAQGIPIECSGFYEAWPKASRLNAVDSIHCDWMQWTPCSVVKWIPIECSGFHEAWLNALYSMKC